MKGEYNLKPFKEFYNSSKDELYRLTEEVIQEHFHTRQSLSPTELASKIITVNQLITLDTLRLYHDWLSEQDEP